MLIKEVDADGNGTIDFGEFLSLMGRYRLFDYDRKMKNIESEEELRDVFKYFDTDNDGMITPNDLKRALKREHDSISN